MSESTEQNQAVEAQAQAGVTDQSAELLQRIQLLEANNAKLLDEKKATAKQPKRKPTWDSSTKFREGHGGREYRAAHAERNEGEDIGQPASPSIGEERG